MIDRGSTFPSHFPANLTSWKSLCSLHWAAAVLGERSRWTVERVRISFLAEIIAKIRQGAHSELGSWVVQRKPVSELPKMEIVNLQLQTPGSSFLTPYASMYLSS